MTGKTSFRTGLRYAQRVALVSFGMAASALADGNNPFLVTTAFSNEVEGALVRAFAGLREQGLKHAMGEVDRMLARNPNYRLGHLLKGDLLMTQAGRPIFILWSLRLAGWALRLCRVCCPLRHRVLAGRGAGACYSGETDSGEPPNIRRGAG